MKNSPFQRDSPILHLYERSRSKSQTNRLPTVNRVKSFRDFQVKMITSALNQQHIIQKEYKGEEKREMRRERQFSKYYGIQTFRLNAQSQEPSTKRPAQQTENRHMSQRTSQKISTMINIKPQTANCINSQRYMSYESNYLINNMEYRASEYMVGSTGSLSKSNSMRSSGRKISFFSETESNPYEQQNRNKRSRFMQDKKPKIDGIKEEINEDYMLTKKSSNFGKHA